jgi:hypothetical protein
MNSYQEKIGQVGPQPATSEPADVLRCNRTLSSLLQENTWLKEQLARIVRSK